jgi:hypothetical protein
MVNSLNPLSALPVAGKTKMAPQYRNNNITPAFICIICRYRLVDLVATQISHKRYTPIDAKIQSSNTGIGKMV